MMNRAMFAFAPAALIFSVLSLIMMALSIYCLVLFIKLARRGITALDIYISKNMHGPGPNNMEM